MATLTMAGTLIMAGGATVLRMGTQDSPAVADSAGTAASPAMLVAAGTGAVDLEVEDALSSPHRGELGAETERRDRQEGIPLNDLTVRGIGSAGAEQGIVGPMLVPS
jgi:hypothetical protein